MIDEFAIEVRKELEKLSDKARLLFAVLTCDHLYPNYVHFQKAIKWGNSELLREAIDITYQHLLDKNLYTSDDIQLWIDSVDLITPHTENFPDITSSYALDACTAVLSTLKFIIDSNLDCIVEVAIYARDTVDMYIQIQDDLDGSDPTTETRIATNPFMIKEKNRQYDIIKKLAILNLNYIDDSLIRSLKAKYPIIDVV